LPFSTLENHIVRRSKTYPHNPQTLGEHLLKARHDRQHSKKAAAAKMGVCPNNKQLLFIHIRKDKSKNSYISHSRLYECEDCSGCPFEDKCKKSIYHNLTILVNEQLERYKQQMQTNLRTKKVDKLKRRRGYEVESCFGDLKMNQGFRRFGLRGKEKVKTEAGIHIICHNIRKIHFQNNKKAA
jgi:hypothetical protein